MNTHTLPGLLRFACDSIPDCSGQIVQRIGDFVLLEGMAADSGAWFARGPGGPRRFNSRQEATDYIEYAQPMAHDGGPGSGPGGTGASKSSRSPDKIRAELNKIGNKPQNHFEKRRIGELQSELKQAMGKAQGVRDEAMDEPIAADPEEVKKAWGKASAAGQKSNQTEKSAMHKKDYGGASEDAADCDATDAAPIDILHQIEGQYRNMDAPTIASKRKDVIAIMDNAANTPAIRDAAKNLLLRMNREEDKMHGDAKIGMEYDGGPGSGPGGGGSSKSRSPDAIRSELNKIGNKPQNHFEARRIKELQSELKESMGKAQGVR